MGPTSPTSSKNAPPQSNLASGLGGEAPVALFGAKPQHPSAAAALEPKKKANDKPPRPTRDLTETIGVSIRDRAETTEGVCIFSLSSSLFPSLPVACPSAHGLFRPWYTPSTPCVPHLVARRPRTFILHHIDVGKQARSGKDGRHRRFSGTPSHVPGAARLSLSCRISQTRMRILQRDQGYLFGERLDPLGQAGWDIIRLPL
ncbi:hypothetical protein B0J15DRAFT_263759 [Fusarium solani]|uniref:Uncharacterized protein n=1 Tax=Fusarium solani TaxID=169388 RepID=A0A9P9HVR3_FUSSL|nr:uncharacterized protein B0J15DRAFT_263759 [Fusarium solani]KAH7264126.1 hypothetical protein B0J15DRAFT_263759 [Fusarium solani]